MRIRSLILLLFNVSLTTPALACECVGSASVKSAMEQADIVFNGRVISVDTILADEIIDSARSIKYTTQLKRYKVSVSQIYKGAIATSPVSVITGFWSGACGVEFKIGEDYLIYGQKRPNVDYSSKSTLNGPDIYWTTSCNRTKPFDVREHKELSSLIAPRCNCSQTDFIELSKSADLILEGEAVKKIEVYNFRDLFREINTPDTFLVQDLIVADKYQVKVTKVHRGHLQDHSITVYARAPFPVRDDSCKLNLELNKKYIFFLGTESIFPGNSTTYYDTEQLHNEVKENSSDYYMDRCKGTRHFDLAEAKKLKLLHNKNTNQK